MSNPRACAAAGLATGLAIGWWVARDKYQQVPDDSRRQPAPSALNTATATAKTESTNSSASVKAATLIAAEPNPATALTLHELRDVLRRFAGDRDWDQFHTPRNLALALVGEVGELCECFQWKGEVEPGLPGFSEQEKEHIGA